MAMVFQSILFANMDNSIQSDELETPACFVDLNLDQIVDTITADKQEYRLKPFFYTPLKTVDEVMYRQEIMRDLENPTLFAHIQSFAQAMRAMRESLGHVEKLHYRYQKERWFLDAVDIYCHAVKGLVHDISGVALQSRGLLAFRTYVTDYLHSERFSALLAETSGLKADLSTVKYCLRIKGNSVRVSKYDGEIDYSAEIAATFEKFKQGAVKDYRVKFHDWPDMNHVEAQILDMVAKLYPEIFLHLDDYCAKNSAYLDETIARFDREIQFYVAYLEHMARFKKQGLPFCYPTFSNPSKEVYAYASFDLALAHKLTHEQSPLVCNDFYLKGKERVIVVTGPNQGGKTTFARMFGQVHYLASIGCPVPGKEARLFLFDSIFTHFEQEENIKDRRSKLEDDLVRIYDILRQATPASIIIMNEILTSTTVSDALFLSKKIMEHVLALDALSVWVTFIDELASLGEQTVSMASTIVPENPAQRTFKVIRKPADGLAYAIAIAEKYRLTYHAVKERISS